MNLHAQRLRRLEVAHRRYDEDDTRIPVHIIDAAGKRATGPHFVDNGIVDYRRGLATVAPEGWER